MFGKLRLSQKNSKNIFHFIILDLFLIKYLFIFFSTKSEQEQQMAPRPLSAYGLNRAVTNFAKNAAKSYNPRFLVNLKKFINKLGFFFKFIK